MALGRYVFPIETSFFLSVLRIIPLQIMETIAMYLPFPGTLNQFKVVTAFPEKSQTVIHLLEAAPMVLSITFCNVSTVQLMPA